MPCELYTDTPQKGGSHVNAGTMKLYAKGLAREVDYTVLVPPEEHGTPHVLLQLHGMHDDHTAWLTKSNIARHATGYPFLIVMPSGENSFYMNWGDWANYEDFLVKDLYAHVLSNFRVKEGPWAIGGLAMGGFGAMRLGLKYPQRFRSIWAHSGWYGSGVELHRRFPGVPLIRAMTGLTRGEVDLLPYAEIVAQLPDSMRPRIGFDCGTEDELLPMNRELHNVLAAMRIAHEYQEHPGGHDWTYWDTHVQTAMAFHADSFGVTRRAR
jgi:putative tributyrin esterase